MESATGDNPNVGSMQHAEAKTGREGKEKSQTEKGRNGTRRSKRGGGRLLLRYKGRNCTKLIDLEEGKC